jgi:hypothetical protein
MRKRQQKGSAKERRGGTKEEVEGGRGDTASSSLYFAPLKATASSAACRMGRGDVKRERGSE